MPDMGYVDHRIADATRYRATPRRLVLLAIVTVSLLAGVLATDPAATAAAVADAGPDLARLLRAMAGIKAAAAVALVAVLTWRLAVPISRGRFAAYLVASAAMAAGPGLIWGMVSLPAGALLLHGGAAAALLLLWRDPAMAHRLDAAIARRRARR